MERLSAEGTCYERALAPAPWTLPSTASMLSGLLPTEHGITGDCIGRVDRRPTSPESAVRSHPGPWLPDTLRERGYLTLGVSCNPWVSTWGGFDRGFDRFADVVTRQPLPGIGRRVKRRLRQLPLPGSRDKGGGRAVEQLRRWVSEAGSTPWFAMVNLMELHSPYAPPPRYHPMWRSGANPSSPGRLRVLLYQSRQLSLRERPGPRYAAAMKTLYYSAGRYEDELVGRLVGVLRDSDRPGAVAVVSDHGEHLGEQGLFGHHSSLREALLHVPLVTWGHRVEVGGERVKEPVSLLRLGDWFRTLADGRPAPIQPNGPVVSEYESTVRHRGFPPAGPPRSRSLAGPAYLVSRAGLAIRSDGLKYVATEDGQRAVYDVSADASEETDLLPDRADLRGTFDPMFEAWRARRAAQPSFGPGGTAEMEMADHLRELGYIE